MSRKNGQINRLIGDYLRQVTPPERVLDAAKTELFRTRAASVKPKPVFRLVAAIVSLVLLFNLTVIALPFILLGGDNAPNSGGAGGNSLGVSSQYSLSDLKRKSVTRDEAVKSADGLGEFLTSLGEISDETYYSYSFAKDGDLAFVAARITVQSEYGSRTYKLYFEITGRSFDEFEKFNEANFLLDRTTATSFNGETVVLEYSSLPVGGEYLGRFSCNYGSVRVYADLSSSYPFE
jgi:hypothetical protein